MAYGGMRVGQHLPIGQRAVGGRPPQAPGALAAGEPDPPAARSRVEPPLHCWVAHPGGRGEPAPDGTARAPGVLVEWQHDGDRWWGLVVFVVVEDGQPAVVTRSVPAQALTPA